jgi:hypothetical protein
MPAWLPPLTAGLLAVLVLNAAWLVQRLRRPPNDWPARFARELRHWNGRVPDELRR